MQSLWLIFQLLCCLCLGFVLAKRLPRIIEKIAFQLLPYFSYILLIAIAMEFSQTLGSLQQPSHILSTALQIAFATSIGAFLCCYLLYKGLGLQATQGKVSLQLLIQSCINISYAFLHYWQATCCIYFLVLWISKFRSTLGIYCCCLCG